LRVGLQLEKTPPECLNSSPDVKEAFSRSKVLRVFVCFPVPGPKRELGQARRN